jgi:hypothetical protein
MQRIQKVLLDVENGSCPQGLPQETALGWVQRFDSLGQCTIVVT